jgi:CP family cyanate transporter-like MFS transporter
MALCAGAAGAAAASAPLEQAFGGRWSLALAVWAVPALLAMLIWIPLKVPPAGGPAARGGGLWGDRLAWQVVLFFGMASGLAYAIFAWLAPMLRARGLPPVDAGLVVSVSILVQAPAALFGPMLIGRGRDQRLAGVVFFGCSIVGLAGCLFAPLWSIWPWAVILGIGQGATFAVALNLIVLRAPDPASTARLSAMTQGLGYIIGSTGPLLMGVLRSASQGWTVPAIAFLVLGFIGVAAALGAGRDLYVRPAPERAARDPAAPGEA